MPVVLYGPAYSTYARTVRLALEAKCVPYGLHAVDTLAAKGRSPNTSLAHPWGEVPVLDHDGFPISETAAIARCVRVDADRERRSARMGRLPGGLVSMQV